MAEPSERVPLRAVVSRWCADPEIASAYSYLRPGGTPADRELLAQPLAPGLHLAGEATWAAHPGTMHGAYWSGTRAADAVFAERAGSGTTGTVVVVGAGLAGLAAVRRLHDAGVPAVVLEVSDRIGGRAQADASLGVTVHLGASWIHGDLGNPIAELAHRVGVRTTPSRPGRRRAFLEGHGPIEGLERDRLEAAWDGLEAAIEAAAATEPEDRALGPVVRELLDANVADPTDRLVLWSWVRSDYESIYSAPIDDLSLRYRSEPFLLAGDNVAVLDSLDLVMDELARGLDVRTGHRVTAIRSDPTGVDRLAVDVDGGDTIDGTIGAHDVIVTVPLGALQAGRVTFTPPLPPAVTEALHHLGPGRVAKVVATFGTAFWGDHAAFAVVADPPVPLPVWIDVSALTGVPALSAFATAAAVDAVQDLDEDALRQLAASILADLDLT